MRLPAYEFPRNVSNEVQEAIEDIRMLINNGKYQLRIVTAEPTYEGEEGELVIYNAGASKYLFSYIDGNWWYVQLTQGPLP